MKDPSFELANQIVADVAKIAELAGRLSSTDRLSTSPALRRSSRITEQQNRPDRSDPLFLIAISFRTVYTIIENAEKGSAYALLET